MHKIKQKSENNSIPVKLTEEQFQKFIFPHLSVGSRGPGCSIPLFKVFNYILKVLYTGMQWNQLPIDLNQYGVPEIHYTRIFKIYKRWANDGSLQYVFESSVNLLSQANLLKLSILHGDGTSTIAKKGGDNLGYSGHKHFKGEKIVALVDRNCNVIAPFTTAPGNQHETTLFPNAFNHVKRILKNIGHSLKNIVISLDSAYDSFKNRKQIFNSGMIPNIKENPRNRIKNKRGRKRIYSTAIFQERFFYSGTNVCLGR